MYTKWTTSTWPDEIYVAYFKGVVHQLKLKIGAKTHESFVLNSQLKAS